MPQLIDAQYGEVGKEQDVLLLPTPTTLKAHVANTTAVQWRLTNLDMHEFLWLDGEQVKPGYWESEWGNAFPPPPSPGYLLLYAQVQPGVPDSPDFRRQGDLRWALLAKVKVKAE